MQRQFLIAASVFALSMLAYSVDANAQIRWLDNGQIVKVTGNPNLPYVPYHAPTGNARLPAPRPFYASGPRYTIQIPTFAPPTRRMAVPPSQAMIHNGIYSGIYYRPSGNVTGSIPRPGATRYKRTGVIQMGR